MHGKSSFTGGLIAGSLIGAAVSMAVAPNIPARSRRMMMRGSRNMLRRSGRVIGNIMDMMM